MRRASIFLSKVLRSSLSPQTLLKPSGAKAPLLPYFPKCPSRTLHSHPSPLPPALSPRQRKLMEKSNIEETFESATSTEEILSSFKELETTLDPFSQKLGLACLKVGQHLDSIGYDDQEQVLEFAMRALTILEFSEKNSISVAMALHLVGSACYNLKRFNDSLGHLNRAHRIISVLEKDGSEGFDIRPVSHAVNLQLANTKTAMGRREESFNNLRRCLEIKQSIFDPNSRELGNGYRDLAEAYAAVLNFKEALPLCLKALEIHQGKLGQNSVEVAHDRRLLGVIYTGLEKHDKALEENQQSQKVLRNWGMGSDILTAEIDAANIQISLGKFEEAIQTLKGVVHQTEKGSETRALVYIFMAKALSNQGNANADSKRCLDAAQQIFKEKEDDSPESVSEAYVEIGSVYEALNEFDKAIDILKRSLEIIERLPCKQHLEGNTSAKIGWLLLLTGKVSEAVTYLESAVERMKESFGPKHFGVGYIYNNLGAAYMELDRPQTAAQMFAQAKEIMDISLGPHHADSIQACQSLANAYSAMGSYSIALDIQKKVVDAWSSHGPRARDELKEASRIFEQLKKKALEGLKSTASPGVRDYDDKDDDNDNDTSSIKAEEIDADLLKLLGKS
ncbi:Tetratricopeptide repeat (TPR)-like superfamily protein [Rhynchospora pubera]|uniref:Tetratricopeptide repeat (TPR)-like superfamily protein n=1 Tax=Rhynchospora pubera TaxID=906938 RepID=A0AAV8GNV5_9POAL|nr:Tetratricopeptide repeat (TPR)-like superfamily protein [Rhynchospora pubera]KAJ4806005.1 Tetratricopeptide repeat (TPR)-like superfamily protein [Rhynchospora pubera]